MQKGMPKGYLPSHYQEGLFVVEVQKTRTGKKKKGKEKIPGTELTITTTEAVTSETRPYSVNDFDILAVNMHPSSRDWTNFRYTVASWLIVKSSDKNLFETHQPVAEVPNDVWTDDLATCLRWLEEGEQRDLLSSCIHLKRVPKKSGKPKERVSRRKRRGKSGE